MEVPGRVENQCTSAIFAGKMRKSLAKAKELYRLYYASNDAETDFAEFEQSLERVADHYIKRLESIDDEFLLNCYEYAVRGKLGTYTVLAVDSYFPNKRTTHTELQCSLYSQFVHTTPCMQFLTKLETGPNLVDEDEEDTKTEKKSSLPTADSKISKEEKFAQDQLISGAAIDEQNDDLLKDCLQL